MICINCFGPKNVLVKVDNLIVMKNTYGPLFWGFFFYSYSLLAIGTILMFYRFLISNTLHRYRVVYLIMPIFPLVANIFKFININPLGYLDLTPFAFTISGILILWGASSNFKLEIIPIARNVFFENSEDGFITIDQNGEILNCNTAIFKITGFKDTAEVQSFLKRLSAANLKIKSKFK